MSCALNTTSKSLPLKAVFWCESPFFLRTTDLVIPKERTPGTTVEHKGLHERSFGLDGVHQIVSGPRLKHLPLTSIILYTKDSRLRISPDCCTNCTRNCRSGRECILTHLPLSPALANCLITVSHANSEKKCLLRQLSRIRFQWLLQMLGRSCTPGRAIESFVAVKNDRRLDLLSRSFPQQGI
jgi:hypothetical protein